MSEGDLKKATDRLRENYETILGVVKSAAAGDTRHFSDSNKKDINGSLHQFVTGYHLAVTSDDPEVLRAAIGMVIPAAFFIGLRCAPTVSHKKYWNLIAQGKGGGITGKRKHEGALIWQNWVLDEIKKMNAKGKWLKLSASRVAEELKNRKSVPVVLPEKNRLERFISKSREANAVSDKRKEIRLVQG